MLQKMGLTKHRFLSTNTIDSFQSRYSVRKVLADRIGRHSRTFLRVSRGFVCVVLSVASTSTTVYTYRKSACNSKCTLTCDCVCLHTPHFVEVIVLRHMRGYHQRILRKCQLTHRRECGVVAGRAHKQHIGVIVSEVVQELYKLSMLIMCTHTHTNIKHAMAISESRKAKINGVSTQEHTKI